ncbi:MAG: hypothetical protein KatS3mg053_3435 [Candidatus Roseilinea sp.]|nr:MAG: hypothetical protein KatS3mg053_3435 [Candidatus Roseilinea sp.]
MSKRTIRPATRDEGTLFMATLRQTLEHIGDAEWLKDHSPLESIRAFGDGAAESARSPAPPIPSLGIRALDERLQAVWQDWETRPKTGLQALLWSAVRQVKPDKDANYPALLVLTYFQDPRPKQGDLIRQLAVGQSTYYRQLGAAVEALQRVVLSNLQLSLRLESPAARPLIGRDAVLHQVMAALHTGGVVSLIGASGLGKTSLGAALCQAWSNVSPSDNRQSKIENRKFFWLTFRPGLTDNLHHVIFALAFFLHQRRASDLWLHLTTRPQDLGPGKAMAMIRKSLDDLKHQPPLFCFDEADLLLPDELDDSGEHQQLRAFLEEFAESPRNGAPLLFIGQRLLIEPERGRVFTLERFTAPEVHALFEQANVALDATTCQAVLSYTRGNPLLAQLLITLHQLGEPVLDEPSRLASSASLDWFIARLRRHLSPREQDLLDAMCVFDSPAPAGLWRKRTRPLDRLIQLGLVRRDAPDLLSLLPAVREALYRQLPGGVREGLHASAAQACAEQGAFTLAAHHYTLGQQPEMAIWTWHAHRDEEVRQGQAQTALRIFTSPGFAALAGAQDRRALALIVADLCHLLGKHDDGLSALDAAQWPHNRPASSRMRELRAKLLAMRGDVDAALANYRAGLDALPDRHKPILLRVEMGRQTLFRARDAAAAKAQAILARHDVEVLLGDIEREAGHLDAAAVHYLAALDVAHDSEDPVRLAKINEVLGILEARRLNVDAAQRYLAEAGAHYSAYGNAVCAVGMTNSNKAFAYLMAGRYADAIAPAQQAIAFFEALQLPYDLSINQANLAEAYANLGDAEQAEAHARRALAHEEAAVHAQCLYVLGHARRLQGRFEEAERLCKDAIANAEATGDQWARAYAQRTLGEVYRDWGKREAARAAFERAHEAFVHLGLHADAARVEDTNPL